MLKIRKLTVIAGLAGVITTGATAAALATGTTFTTGSGTPIVYHTVQPCCQTITLGPQSSPTFLGDTPPLGGGWYLVSYAVGVAMGPSDNVVCAAAVDGQGNDGVFGTVGNGATESGTGPNGIYGQAATVDTIHATAGQKIGLTCNVGHFGQGTYVGGWSLTATKIGTLTKKSL
jgi:hypothetical protein